MSFKILKGVFLICIIVLSTSKSSLAQNCNSNLFTQSIKTWGAPTMCEVLLSDPSHPLATADCDGGGIDNLTECQNGADPEDPSDDVICTDLSASPLLTKTALAKNYRVNNCWNESNDLCTYSNPNQFIPSDDNLKNIVSGLTTCAGSPNNTGPAPLGGQPTCDPSGPTVGSMFHTLFHNTGLYGLPEITTEADGVWVPTNPDVYITEHQCTPNVFTSGDSQTEATCVPLDDLDNGQGQWEMNTVEGWVIIPCGRPITFVVRGAGLQYKTAYISTDDGATFQFMGENTNNGGDLDFTVPAYECCSGEVDYAKEKAYYIKLYNLDPTAVGQVYLYWNYRGLIDPDRTTIDVIVPEDCFSIDHPDPNLSAIPDCNSTSIEICDFVTVNPTSQMAIADCDNGGIDNLTECQNGGDPNDPSDDVECISEGDLSLDNISTSADNITKTATLGNYNLTLTAQDATTWNPANTGLTRMRGIEGQNLCVDIEFDQPIVGYIGFLITDLDAGCSTCANAADAHEILTVTNPTSATGYLDASGANPVLPFEDMSGNLIGLQGLPEWNQDGRGYSSDGWLYFCNVNRTEFTFCYEAGTTGQSLSFNDIEINCDPTFCPVSCYSSSTEICAEVLANPASNLASLDCDNGGVPNLLECQNGDDPLDDSDDTLVSSDCTVKHAYVIDNQMNHDPDNPTAVPNATIGVDPVFGNPALVFGGWLPNNTLNYTAGGIEYISLPDPNTTDLASGYANDDLWRPGTSCGLVLNYTTYEGTGWIRTTGNEVISRVQIGGVWIDILDQSLGATANAAATMAEINFALSNSPELAALGFETQGIFIGGENTECGTTCAVNCQQYISNATILRTCPTVGTFDRIEIRNGSGTDGQYTNDQIVWMNASRATYYDQ